MRRPIPNSLLPPLHAMVGYQINPCVPGQCFIGWVKKLYIDLNALPPG